MTRFYDTPAWRFPRWLPAALLTILVAGALAPLADPDLPMHLAVGTSLLAIALNALWGLIGNLRFGTLDWPLTLLFATGGVIGVLAGGKLAGRLPDRTLRVAFALLIVVVALYTFGRSLATILAT